MNRCTLGLVLAIAAIAGATSANAADMSASPTAPTIDGADIASYGTPTGTDKWWPGPSNVFGNPGMTVGQTFTIGSQSVWLNSFTFQISPATQPTKTYTVRVGQVSDTTFTTLATESVTQDFATADNDYWTWTFDSPVLLSANEVYGVDVGLNSSTSAWQTGIPYVKRTADEYADGTRFRSGTEGNGIGDDTMTHTSGERIFHVDLSLPTAALPGDANDNGFVDDVDLAILLGNWESEPLIISTWALGNFTEVSLGDTDVDDSDLAVLLGNWTGPPPPGGALVPEPATLALLTLGGLSVLRRRRRSCLRP